MSMTVAATVLHAKSTARHTNTHINSSNIAHHGECSRADEHFDDYI